MRNVCFMVTWGDKDYFVKFQLEDPDKQTP